MPANDTIGVGLIGAGDISILHARAVKKCPGAKLVGLWNRSQDRAKQRATEFGCKSFISPEALVNDPGIHAVFVLTNLETHLVDFSDVLPGHEVGPVVHPFMSDKECCAETQLF